MTIWFSVLKYKKVKTHVTNLDKITTDELYALRRRVDDELERRGKPRPAVVGGRPRTDGETQREYWGGGWLQKDPRRKKLADDTEKVYRYWVYHYIEDGQHKTEYIGSDEKLEQWKAAHPE